METETIDRLFIELSQFARAKTARELKMEAALQKISQWFGHFPDTGRTWDDGTPMSYSACFGSNGERDFMRQIAADALGIIPVTDGTLPDSCEK